MTSYARKDAASSPANAQEHEPLMEMRAIDRLETGAQGGPRSLTPPIKPTASRTPTPAPPVAGSIRICGVTLPPALASCFVYTFCSITMVLANKALASKFKANIDLLTISFQSTSAVILILGCDAVGILQLGTTIQRSIAIKWLPVNCFFVAMLATGFLSLKYLNVPMVTIFKNLTNVLIMWGEYYFYGQPVTSGAMWSCVVMIIGAMLAAANDITFNGQGYFWMGCNCFCTAGYLLYMKHATRTVKINKFGQALYNNVLSLPILWAGALLRGEFTVMAERAELHTQSFVLLNLYAGFVGFFLNLATLWCVQTNTATTYAIVGSLNKIPLAFIGWALFKTPITRETIIFISLSMLGGFMYSYSKLREAETKAETKPQDK